MKQGNLKYLFLLHLLLMLYSLSGIASKLAAKESFLSFRFCLYYGCIIVLLGIYAIGWQQIIKHLPLTTAYSNKAVTIVWGLVWGVVVFREGFTVGKVLGAVLVIAGVVLFCRSDDPQPDGKQPVIADDANRSQTGEQAGDGK